MPVETWTRYQLRRRLFSIAEDFWIKNDRGEAVYKVNGRLLQIRETFIFEDPNGAELATIKAKLLAWSPTMTIERGGKVYATVTKSILTFLHQRFSVEVTGGQTLEAEGDITNHEYQVRAGDATVAEISKRWFTIRETYGMAIAPGQDDVLLLAATICIDELAEREREHRA